MDSKYNFNIKLELRNNNISSKNDYTYDIRLLDNNNIIGNIDIRPIMNPYLYYYGQIGYHIYPEYRNNNYAYKACLLIFELAKYTYNINELYITCSPDNIPSYKTLLKLKGRLIEVTEVPHEHELYYRDEKVKCIFHYDLNTIR